VYKDTKDNTSGWYLKDGRGTVQGFICEWFEKDLRPCNASR
jgi:hypothetical protein